MSKLLYIAFRDKKFKEKDKYKLKSICNSLVPDNIESGKNLMLFEENIGAGIINPHKSFLHNGLNIFFGEKFGVVSNWEEVGSSHPDGNFVLIRKNKNSLEVISDVLATKALWYFKDDSVFIASTSQRAIVKFIGNFEFNESLIPWQLCNGMLGPGNSWDKRIQLLEPDSSLILNRNKWSYKVHSREIFFNSNELNDEENIALLKETLKQHFDNLNLNYTNWQLSLSGGYDSRGNLCFLSKKDMGGNSLNTLSWGVQKSEEIFETDASVAKDLAEEFGLKHSFLSIEQPQDKLEAILERFLKNGEGRIDHLGGYADGFGIWKKLYENEIEGIIRGDEVFGSYNFISDFHLKNFIGLSVYSDFDNLKDVPYLKSFDQTFPAKFNQRSNETWAQWRDRLYQSHCVPIFLTALTDLKDLYTSQINPLISRDIVNLIRQLPDHLRTDKKAFRIIVNEMSPKIRYASKSSTSKISKLIRQEAMVEIILEELNSPLSHEIFDEDFLNMVTAKLTIEKDENISSKRFLSRIKAIVPKNLKRKIIRRTFVPVMDMNTLAFRAYMIVKMHKIFTEDSKTQY